MRILQLGDTHLGIRGSLIGAPRGVDRAADHLAAFDASLRPALEGRVDCVIHTGDLFDRSRPPSRAVLQAAERLTRVARQVPTVVIAGNHDRRGLLRYIPHRLPGLHVVDRPTVIQLSLPGGTLRIAALPFVRCPTDWSLRAAALCESGVDLLVAHQGFDGDRVPGFTFRVGRPRDTLGVQHLPAGLEWLLSGHIHPRQAVELGGCTVVHAGSTERTAFSERDQTKGSVLWEWGGTVRWQFVDGPSRPMVRITGPAELGSVTPGAWVTLPRHADDALRQAVVDRGGFLRPAGGVHGGRRTRTPEEGLFAATT